MKKLLTTLLMVLLLLGIMVFASTYCEASRKAGSKKTETFDNKAKSSSGRTTTRNITLSFTAECVLVRNDPQLRITGTTIPSGIVNFTIFDGPRAPLSSNVVADSSGNFLVEGIDLSTFSTDISVSLFVADPDPSTDIVSSEVSQTVSLCVAAPVATEVPDAPKKVTTTATVVEPSKTVTVVEQPKQHLPVSGSHAIMTGVTLVIFAVTPKLISMIIGRR